MRGIFRFFSLRHVLRHPFRVLLSGLTVALGVALFVSVDVANTSTQAALGRGVDQLAGGAQLQVVRGRGLGVEEEALARVESVAGIRAAPVLQVSASLAGRESAPPLLILGVDFRREARLRSWDIAGEKKPQINPLAFLLGDAIVLTRTFAKRHGLAPGATLAIHTPEGPRRILVGAIVKDEGPAAAFDGNVATMPLRSLQRLFLREGRLDRIDVGVDGRVEEAARRLRDALGPDYEVRPPPRSNSVLEEALTRIRALGGISLVALLVAMFIIYNSVSVSVVERIREIGCLRAVGATRGQIGAAILGEWVILGAAASAVGIAGGAALSTFLIRMTADEVNQVAVLVDVGEVVLLPRTLAGALLLGTLTTVLAAGFPARQAMLITPIELLRYGSVAIRTADRFRGSFGLGLGTLALAALGSAGPVWIGGQGLVGALLLFLGTALVLPQVVLWIARGARRIFPSLFGTEGYLAADDMAKFPQRAALAIAALAGAIAMMVSATAVILSFKVRNDAWIEETLAFDVLVTAGDFAGGSFSGAALPEGMLEDVRGMEGVERVCAVRSALQGFGEKDVMLVAFDVEAHARMQERRGRAGLVPPGTREELAGGTGVVVSRNFAEIHGAAAGSEVSLLTPQGRRRFRVLAAVEDYRWPQGTVFLDRALYRELWKDPLLTDLEVALRPGVPQEEVRRRLARLTAERGSCPVYDAKDLKRLSGEVLDRTLRFTHVQVAVAVLIGFLGIVNTLFISVLRRRREIGLLRALGMSRGQAARMVILESVLLALLGSALGAVLGLAAAGGPLSDYVLEISGYRVPLAVPWGTVLAALGAAALTGVLAGYLPARHAARLDVLEAISYE